MQSAKNLNIRENCLSHLKISVANKTTQQADKKMFMLKIFYFNENTFRMDSIPGMCCCRHARYIFDTSASLEISLREIYRKHSRQIVGEKTMS